MVFNVFSMAEIQKILISYDNHQACVGRTVNTEAAVTSWILTASNVPLIKTVSRDSDPVGSLKAER